MVRKNGVKRKGHLCKEEKRYELPERGLHPFLGSGSTLIAGEKTDHVCRGIEFDPKFVDVIVKRYIEQVGNADSVSLQRDGLTYRYEEVAGDDAEDIPLF